MSIRLTHYKTYRRLRHWTLLRLRVFPRTIVLPAKEGQRDVALFSTAGDAYVAAVLHYEPATLGDAYLMLEVLSSSDGTIVGRRKIMPDRTTVSAIFSSAAAGRFRARINVMSSERPVPIRITGFNVKKLREQFAAPAVHFGANRTTVSVATFPPRLALFRDTFPTIRDQADNVFCYLNNYRSPPDFVRDSRAQYIVDTASGLRAAAKFHWAQNEEGYHFLVDDDIFYPPDYVVTLVKAIERYRRRAIVGVHGMILHKRVERFPYRRETLNFYLGLPEDKAVHMLGTGTMAFHSSTVSGLDWRLLRDHVASNDEAFAVMARRAIVPMVAVAREPDWLRSHPGMTYGLFEEKGLQPAMRTPVMKLLAAHNPWPRPTMPTDLAQHEAA